MKVILPVLLLILSGCASHRSELSRSTIPNLNRQTLISCLGMPDSQEENGDQDIYTYSSTMTEALCPLKSLVGMNPPVHHCQAVFVLEGDKVRSINYRQQDADMKQSASYCEYILENCGK
jgi:hypothetical protein